MRWEVLYVASFHLIRFVLLLDVTTCVESKRQPSAAKCCQKPCAKKIIPPSEVIVQCRRRKCQCIPKAEIPLNVTKLDLSNNYLLRLTANSFAEYTELTIIDLFNNKLKNISNGAFNGLHELETLNLSSNPISIFGDNLFSDLKSLKYLSLDNVSMTRCYFKANTFLPQTNLDSLLMSHNNLDRFPEFQRDGLSLVPFIKTLVFNYNSLTNLKSEYFNGIESVEYMKLASNRINIIYPECFKNLPNLRELILTKNILGGVTRTAFLSSSIKSLIMSESENFVINRITETVFEHLPDLSLKP